jgi:hypothetical protein
LKNAAIRSLSEQAIFDMLKAGGNLKNDGLTELIDRRRRRDMEHELFATIQQELKSITGANLQRAQTNYAMADGDLNDTLGKYINGDANDSKLKSMALPEGMGFLTEFLTDDDHDDVVILAGIVQQLNLLVKDEKEKSQLQV